MYLHTSGLALFCLFIAIGLTHLTAYAKIDGDMLKRLLGRLKIRRNLGDYKQDVLVKQGREQFKKLVERGTDLPVFLA